VSTDVSEEHIASNFRVGEISSARKQMASSFDTEDGGDMFLQNAG
jgi:hypothetical protein